MKKGEFLKKIFVISLIGTGCWFLNDYNGQADVVTQPTDTMTDVTNSFSSDVEGGDYKFIVPFTKISANYARNGKLTKKTNKVALTVNGTVSNPYGDKWNRKWSQYDGVWFEFYNSKTLALNGSLGGKHFSPSDLPASKIFTLSNQTYSFTLNSKYLDGNGTFWVGNKVRAFWTDYITKQLKATTDQITLKPTITSNLDNGTSTITGTGTQVGDTITVKEGSTSKTTTVGSDGKWSLDWGQKFTGNATVTATESNDYGDTAGTATTTVDQLSHNVSLSLTDGSSYSVAPGKTVNIEGMVSSIDNGSSHMLIINSSFTVHVTLDDGQKIADFKMNGTKANSSKDGYFNLDLPASKLKSGTNKVSFYVTSTYANQSPTVTAIVNLKGSVQLSTVSKSLTFASTEVPTTETLVKPSGTWDVEVDDNLVSGQTWSLYATASALTSGTHTLKGNTVYVDDAGSKHVMTDQSTLVGSGTSTGTEKTTNVAKNWSSSQGIFLDVQPGVYAGQYTGTIDWSLQNTPQS